MTSDDAEPVGVMSRVGGKTRTLTSGGRSCGWHPTKDEIKESKRRKKSIKVEQKAAKKDEKRQSTADTPMSGTLSSPIYVPEDGE